MKSLAKNLAILVAIAPLAQASAAEYPAYGAEPYKQVVLDEAEEVVRWVFLNNTIVESPSLITDENIQAYREEVYALIDTKVKRGYPGTMKSLPRDSGARFYSLAYLFRLAGKLDVWGADLVADNMDTVPAGHVAANMQGFRLRLDGTFLRLTSPKQPWTLTFPYHFMVGNVQRFQDKFGYATELAAVSTGYSKQKAKPGYSQATLLVIVSERSDFEQFRRDWLSVHGSPRRSSEACHWEIPGYDCLPVDKLNNTNVKGNLYFGRHGAYSVLMAYLGLPETFRHNLPHARDFMRAVSWDAAP